MLRQLEVVLLVLKLIKYNYGGAPLCKTIIDEVDTIQRKSNRIRKVKKKIQWFLITWKMPELKRNQLKYNIKQIDVQDGTDVET